MLCVLILSVKWRDLQFKADSERQILWETFHGNFYLLSDFLPENWGSNPGFSSNKPTHYLLDHGDIKTIHYTLMYNINTHDVIGVRN